MVARHPIVMNAVKYYETSKRNYPSFNYAAGIVESAAIPVVNNIEAKLNTRHQTRQASAVSSTDITPTNSNFGDYKIQHDGKNQLQKKEDSVHRVKQAIFLHILQLIPRKDYNFVLIF